MLEDCHRAIRGIEVADAVLDKWSIHDDRSIAGVRRKCLSERSRREESCRGVAFLEEHRVFGYPLSIDPDLIQAVVF